MIEIMAVFGVLTGVTLIEGFLWGVGTLIDDDLPILLIVVNTIVLMLLIGHYILGVF